MTIEWKSPESPTNGERILTELLAALSAKELTLTTESRTSDNVHTIFIDAPEAQKSDVSTIFIDVMNDIKLPNDIDVSLNTDDGIIITIRKKQKYGQIIDFKSK